MTTSHASVTTPRTPAPRSLIILGADGDLVKRLLLPGLATYLASASAPGDGEAGEIDELDEEPGIRLVGAGRGDGAGFADLVRTAFSTVLDQDQLRLPAVRDTLDRAAYLPTDATDEADLGTLLECAEQPAALYFALPPSVTVQSCQALQRLHHSGLFPPQTVLALEKPFGTDLNSARELNSLLTGFVPEEHIFRVDHFLGMPGVLSFMGLRFANRVLEPLWSREHVESIEIVYDETLGLEGRAEFYDSTGAARDMLQSHLLQVMAQVMMDPPSRFDGVEIPANTAHVLRAARLWDPAEPRLDDCRTSAHPPVVRGRYTAGQVDGRQLPSYVDEDGVDPSRGTETFAQVTLEVDTWRWNGVPVTLRSGKGIGSPRQEIAVRFRRPPHEYEQFPHSGNLPHDVLRLGFEPDHLQWELNVGGPFDSRGLNRVTVSSGRGEPGLTAYGSVVRWLLQGERAFTVRGDGAEQGWRITEQILDAFTTDEVPLQDYAAGSDGPFVSR